MTMKPRLLTPADPTWNGILSSVHHDTYHLPGYVAADAERIGGEPFAACVQDGDCVVLLPLIRRRLPHAVDGFDAVSPYGYPGPLASSGALNDDHFLRAAGEAICDELQAARCASAFIRCHPLLPNAEALFRNVGQLKPLGPTVWIDLSCSEEERWVQMDRNTRSSINRTRLDGYGVEAHQDWSRLDEFIRLYRLTMDRAQAAESYYFDEEYFVALREGLDGAAHLLLVSRYEKTVAAGIFLETCGIVQSHLSGSLRLPGGLSGDRVMVDHAATWFASRGNLLLHLGGGRGSVEDSLFRFKAGFAPHRGSYAVWHLITDASLFAEACAAASAGACDTSAPTDFFPPYRTRRHG